MFGMPLECLVATIILIICGWSLVVGVSTFCLMRKVVKYRGHARTGDKVQLYVLSIVFFVCLALLFHFPVIQSLVSTFFALSIGCAFAMLHVSQRQYHNFRRIKKLFQK